MAFSGADWQPHNLLPPLQPHLPPSCLTPALWGQVFLFLPFISESRRTERKDETKPGAAVMWRGVWVLSANLAPLYQEYALGAARYSFPVASHTWRRSIFAGLLWLYFLRWFNWGFFSFLKYSSSRLICLVCFLKNRGHSHFCLKSKIYSPSTLSIQFFFGVKYALFHAQ